MKPAVTSFKDYIKPPFQRGNNDSSFYIFDYDNTTTKSLLSVQDFRFQKRKNYSTLFQDFCNWVVDALNEKWEKSIEEPMYWQKVTYVDLNQEETSYHVCPKCENSMNDQGEQINRFKFCPFCGQSLLPPDDKDNKIERKRKCARIYNDYKCWNSSGCCEHLNNQEKCSAFIPISKDHDCNSPFCNHPSHGGR